jgi:hypothetical protein
MDKVKEEEMKLKVIKDLLDTKVFNILILLLSVKYQQRSYKISSNKSRLV